MTRFNEAIDHAVCESVAHYSATVKQAQDLLVDILGHDLRNPLGTIGMSAQMLMQNTLHDSRASATASLIHKNSMLMGYLIDDLLDFARSRLGQSIPIAVKPMNLADVAQQEITSARVLHPDYTISFESEGDLDGCWDDVRIGQVFLNLTGNAVKHGSADAPVEVALVGGGRCRDCP